MPKNLDDDIMSGIKHHHGDLQKPLKRNISSSDDEFNALLNDSDDDGHRLAEFLLKKKGTVIPDRVFSKYVPRRFSSFKVPLKKVKKKVKKIPEIEQGSDVEAETKDKKHESEKQTALAEQQKNPVNQLQESAVGAVGLADIAVPPPLVEIDAATRKSPLTVPNSPPQATSRLPSQRLSIRNSGGIPSSDHLRRFSLKQRSNIISGRRMLLDEFNSLTPETDFLPNHCSTPMSQKPTSPKTPTKQTAAANKGKTSTNSNDLPRSINESISTDTERLLISLRKRDEELRDVLEKHIGTFNQNLEEQENLNQTLEEPENLNQNLEEQENFIPVLKTPSPKRNISTSNTSMRRRTYTIEKGTQPGQVILTPSKLNTTNVQPLTPNKQKLQQQDANTCQYPLPANPIEMAVYALHCDNANVTPEKTTSSAQNKTPLKASPKQFQILQRIMGRSPQQLMTSLMSTGKTKISSRIPLRTPLGKGISLPEIPNTPLSAVVAEQHEENNTLGNDAEIPETQEQHHVSQLPGTPVRPPTINELSQSLQGTNPPMVVVPIYQTFNQLPQMESHLKAKTDEILSKATGHASEHTPASTENITKKSEDKGVNTTNQLLNKTFDKMLNKSSNKFLNKSAKQLQSQKQADTPRTTATFVESEDILANYIDNDDLRFEDIITDDEDDVPKAPALIQAQNRRYKTHPDCSNDPLNLARSPELCDTRRTSNHLAKRQLRAKNYTEAEIWPPRAHPLTVTRARTRRQQERRNLPLNAEPRTPINGEKFAAELKTNLMRLKNHEILDLRIRNSLGKVYNISGRKSLADKKRALEKQLQLESEIQFELLRRNWKEDEDNCLIPVNQEDDQNQGKNEICEIPPAPEGFRDCTVQSSDNMQQQEINNKDIPLWWSDTYSSSLIDDRSCDRVSFVRTINLRSSTDNKNKKGSRRVKKRCVPEEVQKYLDVSKKLIKRKSSNKSSTKSKRNLYSHRLSSSPSPASPHLSGNVAANNDSSLHLRVDTPPPVLSSAQNSSKNSKSFEIQILKPPQAFSDDEPSANKRVIPIVENENEILKPPQTFSVDEPNMDIRVVPVTENDEEIFKRPLPPPPLRKRKQQKSTKTKPVASKEMSGLEEFEDGKETHLPPPKKRARKKKTAIEEMSGLEPFEDAAETHLPPPKKGGRKKKTVDDTKQQNEHEAVEPLEENETSTLRRSKRGHKPLRNYWSFTSTDPTPLYDFAILERRREEAKRLREMRKNNKTASLGDTNVSSTSSTCSTRPAQKINRLPAISEPEEFAESTRQESERLIGDIPQHELPCTAAVSNVPLKAVDVEKLNNLFDQLKNAPTVHDNITPSTSSSSLPNESHIKNLRVRLKRIKPIKEQPEVPINNEEPCPQVQPKRPNGPPTAVAVSTAAVPEVDHEVLITPNENDSGVLSWLRNISFANSRPGTKIQNTYQELRCSSRGNLVSSDVHGVEYVYYDNDPDGNISYLRFNPNQSKPRKRAKKFHLQFIVLSGEFEFTTNKDIAVGNPGALIKIAIGAHYSIKNMTDKKAILMVLKEKGDAQ